MTAKLKQKPSEAEVAYTSKSWGIRKLPESRWMADILEHSWDVDNKLIRTSIVKSSDPLSWSFILEAWKMWAAADISKLK